MSFVITRRPSANSSMKWTGHKIKLFTGSKMELRLAVNTRRVSNRRMKQLRKLRSKEKEEVESKKPAFFRKDNDKEKKVSL